MSYYTIQIKQNSLSVVKGHFQLSIIYQWTFLPNGLTKMKLSEIATALSCQLDSDGDLEIFGINTLENAREGQLSFFTNNKYRNMAITTKASAVIVDYDCPPLGIPLLKNKNPYFIFAKAIELFYPVAQKSPSIHPTSIISDHAILGENIFIGPFNYISDGVRIGNNVVIESHCALQADVQIGDDSTIHAGCIIRRGSIIGKRCRIQSNTVIGSDGFGYAKTETGGWYKIIQTGIVVIDDDVEIGASATIDNATLGETRINPGVKIDNLVHIGHGCNIGPQTLLCAQVGIAGSTTVGKNVILAGQVGAAGHLTIGDNVIAIAQTGIPNSVESGAIISGSPAIDQKQWLKTSAIIPKLPKMVRTLRDLEKRLSNLEKSIK